MLFVINKTGEEARDYKSDLPLIPILLPSIIQIIIADSQVFPHGQNR